MLIFWRIRYFDRTDKQFKDRDLLLDTATLPPAKKAAVELLAESQTHRSEREFLKFRSLFKEESITDVGQDRINAAGEIRGLSLTDYFEDETGKEITLHEMGPLLTGNPDTILVPRGAKQHDLDYMLAEKTPVPVAGISLSTEDIRLLGYFVRDLQELQNSALMKDGPGTLSGSGRLGEPPKGDYHHETAVTDDEIRSFVTIFRRLYMTGSHDPASFLKVVPIFEKALRDHPLAKWVRGAAGEYEAHLQGIPQYCGTIQGTSATFTVKRLIDVFLYTQYAHQPNRARQRQFTECLQQVGGKQEFLTWLFLDEVRTCGSEISIAGRVIAGWFKRYCNHHGIIPDVLNSLRSEHTGLGTAEKKEARKARLFREKVEELEVQLWKQAGRPEGGPVQFRLLAQEKLKRALSGEEGE